MQFIPKEWLEFLREQYPKGSRIRLAEMGSDPHPIPPGSTGTLQFIDDAGQFHVDWDSGRSLALVIGEDRFQVLPPEPTLLKLYMPLTVELHEPDALGNLSEQGISLNSRDLIPYEDDIIVALALEKVPEEAERGLMHWYSQEDTLNAKVRSAMFNVEVRDGQLWGVAECRVVGELTPKELADLKDYIAGQAADGWGEGFEQHEIEVDGSELYVHLWSCENWSIQTEQERFGMEEQQAQPEMGGIPFG